MKVCEFAGGGRPIFRPNIDVQAGPLVDLVADLNKPLAVSSDQFDGIFMRYGLEHLSWRKVRSFVSECARILKPGGIAVFVVPDTQSMCAMLATKPAWEDKDVGTLYGDQNFDGEAWVHNAHHAGFSPEYAIRLFRESGFYSARTIPLPEWLPGESLLDMIIEARKSAVDVTIG